jgi:hypothetical protein
VKVLGAFVLGFEVIIVLWSIPVAVMAGWRWIEIPNLALIIGGIVLALVMVAVAGTLPRRGAVIAGWVLQVIIVLTGFLVPLMFFIGGIFALLWFYAVRVGTRIDRADKVAE